MGLGAVNAAPCVHGRRSARCAVNKRPQAAARANHRRHSAPLRAPHRVGAIHYATRSAPAPRTQGAASSAGGTIYTTHHITARQNIWPEPVLQVPKRSGQRPRPAHEQEHAAARSARAQLALRLGGSQRVNA